MKSTDYNSFPQSVCDLRSEIMDDIFHLLPRLESMINILNVFNSHSDSDTSLDSSSDSDSDTDTDTDSDSDLDSIL